jgi:glycerophosphoryl diester phosphodiesterase
VVRENLRAVNTRSEDRRDGTLTSQSAGTQSPETQSPAAEDLRTGNLRTRNLRTENLRTENLRTENLRTLEPENPTRELGNPRTQPGNPRTREPENSVFAHRGGAKLRPENTIVAFDHGLSLGADGLELDVHLSRDGIVVVHHDALLDRTTSGRGPLAALRAAELASLDAAKLWPEFAGRGVGIPTLREVLARYPGIPLIIELKVNTEQMARCTIDEVRAAEAIERVSLGSFGTRVLRAARACEPAIATGSSREETRLALYRSWIRWPVRSPAYRAYQVPEFAGSTRVVSPRFIRDAHAAGCVVQVWTVDEESDMLRLLDWGVDGIISDRPDLAVRVVREKRGQPPFFAKKGDNRQIGT